MDSIADILGNRFTFQYDVDARPRVVTRLAQLAGAMLESLTYDTVGRLRTRLQRSGSTILHRDTLSYDLGDRITSAAGSANDGAHYAPLGPLDTIWYGAGGAESYKTDALGHRYAAFGTASFFGTQTYRYVANSERLDSLISPSQQPLTVSGDTTVYTYTSYGARGDEYRRKWFYASGSCNPFCPPLFNMREVRNNSTAYDGSWRVASVSFHLDTIPSPGSSYRQYNRVETYRYDPLGRRVWKQMIRDTAGGVCTTHDKSSGCRNEVTRTVWDGASILYDVRMIADTATANGGEGYPASDTWTGSVGYTNAGGIDAPLDLFKGSTVVVPYTTWNGTFDMGTCPTAKCTDNDAYFPLQNATAFGDAPPPANGPLNWFGEVIGGQTDGSGLQYRRNRYYDARAGQFTQEDLIGLDGGPNLYSLSLGDPVNSADPSGLSPEDRFSIVEYDSPKTKERVDAARRANPAFDALWQRLQASPSTFMFFDRANYPGTGGEGLCQLCVGMPFAVDSADPGGHLGLAQSYPHVRGFIYFDSRRPDPLDSVVHHESVHLIPLAGSRTAKRNQHCTEPFRGVWHGMQNCPSP